MKRAKLQKLCAGAFECFRSLIKIQQIAFNLLNPENMGSPKSIEREQIRHLDQGSAFFIHLEAAPLLIEEKYRYL